MIPDQCCKAIRDWAAPIIQIEEVWIIGSRARGDFLEDSDVDVALIFSQSANYALWFFNSERWQQELQGQIPYNVHLLRGEGRLGNQLVEDAIRREGIMIFRRTVP